MIIAVDGPTSSGLGEANVRFRPKSDIRSRAALRPSRSFRPLPPEPVSGPSFSMTALKVKAAPIGYELRLN